MGGSSEKLSGIINTSSEDFQALTDDIAANSDIISTDALNSAKDFQAAWRDLTSGFSKGATTIGELLLPVLTTLIKGVKAVADTAKKDFIPPLKEIWKVIGPGVTQTLKLFGTQALVPVKVALGVLGGALKVVAGILTLDFGGAWTGVQQIAASVMNGLISTYNNTIGRIPGISKIDMIEVKTAVEVGATAFNDMGDTTEAVATQAGTALQSMEDDTKASATAMGVTSADFQAEEVAKEEAFRAKVAATVAAAIVEEEEKEDQFQQALSRLRRDARVREAEEAEAARVKEAEEQQAAADRTKDLLEAIRVSKADAREEEAADILAAAVAANLARDEVLEAQAEQEQEAADELKAIADKLAADQKAATEAMAASWESFENRQNVVVKAMETSSLNFGELVELLAQDAGVSVTKWQGSCKPWGLSLATPWH